MAGAARRASGPLARRLPRASHGERQLPRASLSRSPDMRRADGKLLGDRLRRRTSMPAPTRPIPISAAHRGHADRQYPAPGPYDFASTDAEPRRWPRTRARSSPIAAWHAPASALRSKSSWMPLHAKRGSSPTKCACAIWSARSRCRSTRGRTSISTAAITPNACAAPWTPSACRMYAGARNALQPDGRLIGVGLVVLRRAGRAWHRRARQMGPPVVPGLRAGEVYGSPRTARRDSCRHAVARSGPRNDVRAGRA